MSVLGRVARAIVFPAVETLIGRKRTVWLARAMTMAARRDVPNQMTSNGELLVQRVARREFSGRIVVFDVGANVGEWSRSFVELARGSDYELHVFEPSRVTFAALSKRLAGAGEGVHLVQQALSSRAGTAELNVVGEGLGVNSLHARPDAHRTETVSLTTIDQYCAERKIAHVHLAKIDAEGHDLHVMEGAAQMLANRAISLIQFEYNQCWIDSRHYLKDAFDLLLPLGYRLGKVTPQGVEFYPGYDFELESFREANYLACLPECVFHFPQLKWWNLK